MHMPHKRTRNALARPHTRVQAQSTDPPRPAPALPPRPLCPCPRPPQLAGAQNSAHEKIGVDKVTLGTGLRGQGQDKFTLGTYKKKLAPYFRRSTAQWLAAWTLAQSRPGRAYISSVKIDGRTIPQSQVRKVRDMEKAAQAAPLLRHFR